MKSRNAIALPFLALAFAGFVSAASAQALTRAEVHKQPVQAEKDGSQFVTDPSYPDVSPVSAQQKQRAHSTGGTAAGTSEAGAPRAATHAGLMSGCVGPVSFCTPYFGS